MDCQWVAKEDIVPFPPKVPISNQTLKDIKTSIQYVFERDAGIEMNA